MRHNTCYGSVTLLNGKKKRVAYTEEGMYIIPDAPPTVWDRRGIPNDLWTISFYVLKPFIDEEVCNTVKGIEAADIPW
jgi:hypothetical protein